MDNELQIQAFKAIIESIDTSSEKIIDAIKNIPETNIPEQEVVDLTNISNILKDISDKLNEKIVIKLDIE